MTTIACDGKSMAGDGQAEVGDTIVSMNRVKLWRLKDASLFGFSGRTVDGSALRAFLEDGGSKPKLSKCSALLLRPDGVILYFNEAGEGCVVDSPAAIGSGGDHALSAMDVGASPEEAVAAAAKRDPFTGGKITVLAL